MLTPREIIRDYLSFLNILHDNSGVTFKELLRGATFRAGADPDGDAGDAAPAEAPVAKEGTTGSENKANKISLFDIDI